MKTVWKYSPRTEALRLLHVAHNITTGFFKLHQFLVLPATSAKLADNIVPLPDLPYLSIPRFWDRVSRIDISATPGIHVTVPEDLIAATQKLMAPTPTPDTHRLQLIWTRYQDQILSHIFALIPSSKNSIKSVTVWPTTFGTSCSFSLCDKPPHHIVIWLRQDQGVASLVEAILTSLTRKNVYQHLGGLWQESEIIVDFLLAYTSLSTLLRKIDPHLDSTLTIKNTRTQQKAGFLAQSEAFLQKIGAPAVSLETIKRLPSYNFTPREKEVLDLLLSHSPQPVTMDQIGDVLFKNNPDAYSLFAISKTIQRLRDKLEKNGISGSYIQTKRGEGYLLVN